MIKTLYYSGLISTTMSAALLVLLVALAACLRKDDGSGSNRIPAAVGRLVGSWGFLVFLLLGTLFNTGYGIYKGYVVPRDYMQDVISAQEYMAGKSLYPDDMTQKFVALIHENPPGLSIWPAGSERRLDEQKARDEAAESPWVQAHPPVMTLFFTPLVRVFGIYGTYFAISILSVASLIAAPILIAKTLKVTLSKVALGALALAILGWAATIEDLRDGQSGPYLTLLCLMGWASLRTGRPWEAGLFVGVAASLKLYPGILLVYFLLKDRRAFLSGLMTVVAGLSLSGLLCGPRSLVEYVDTARFVSDFYSSYSSNISLLASVRRIVGEGESQAVARGVWFAFAAITLTAAFLASRQPRSEGTDEARSIDLGYSYFLSLGVLLTPVAWDHYTVMLLLPLATLAHRELRGDAHEGSTIGYLILLAIMATPFGTFAFARSSLAGRFDDYVLKITLLNIRMVSILALAAWVAWSYALESGIAHRLLSKRQGIPAAEIDQP